MSFYFIHNVSQQQQMMPQTNTFLDDSQDGQHLSIHSRHHLSNAEDMTNNGQLIGEQKK